MPEFPTVPIARVIGPSKAVVIVVAQGVTAAPLQVLNEDETCVSEIGASGRLRMLNGAFQVRGPSIVEE